MHIAHCTLTLHTCMLTSKKKLKQKGCQKKTRYIILLLHYYYTGTYTIIYTGRKFTVVVILLYYNNNDYAKEDPSFSTIRLQHRTNPTWYVYSYTPEKKNR